MLVSAIRRTASIALGGVGVEKDGQATEPERTQAQDIPYDLLYLVKAYNRKEITLDEWMRLTKEWAQWLIQQNTKNNTLK